MMAIRIRLNPDCLLSVDMGRDYSTTVVCDTLFWCIKEAGKTNTPQKVWAQDE